MIRGSQNRPLSSVQPHSAWPQSGISPRAGSKDVAFKACCNAICLKDTRLGKPHMRCQHFFDQAELFIFMLGADSHLPSSTPPSETLVPHDFTYIRSEGTCRATCTLLMAMCCSSGDTISQRDVLGTSANPHHQRRYRSQIQAGRHPG